MKRGQETEAQAAVKRKCPVCGRWYLGPAQRDRHVDKHHPETER